MPTSDASAPVEGILLSDLLAELGPQTATLIGTSDASRIVLGTEFHDALEELPGLPGLLLLAPSTAGIEASGFDGLAARAAELGYAALAVKCRDRDAERLGAIATASGVPLVRVREQVSWRIFEAMLSRIIGDMGHVEDAHREQGSEPLFALANELASYFGGSVAIEDLERRIVAYSAVPGQLIDRLRTQGILARRVPDYPFNDDEYRMVLRSETAIKYPRVGDEEPRIACAIRAGTLPLGSIWAIDPDGDTPLTEEQDQRIRAAASVAAAHMLDDLRVRKASQQPRTDRLRRLLDGTDIAGAELTELGITEERGGTLCVVSLGRDSPATSLAQLRSVVQRQLALHRPEVVTAVRGGRVYALMEYESARSVEELLEPLLPIADRLIGPGSRVAVPGVAHRSGDVATLRELGDRLLDVHAADAGGTAARTPPGAVPGSPHEVGVRARILTVESLRPLLVLERAAEMFSSAAELRSPAIVEMSAADPALAETLVAWCGSFGNVARTARELGVHENTVRYRMRRLEEQYGIHPDDADTLLTTWLQLRANPE
ncbi:PucR family transcriptional regulator [Leucobacter zeae]|nr:PucR family transcriptional regulator [Leucobacter zeae]